MTMGEMVVVMKDGVVQQSGSPMEIYRSPDNIFVAEFIGSPAMNFIAGRIDVPKQSAIGDDNVIEIPVGDSIHVRSGRRRVGSVIGIRPEHLTVASPSDSGRHALRIECTVGWSSPRRETMVEV